MKHEPIDIPKMDKIVVNIGVGEAKDNSKALDAAMETLTVITGQKPIATKAKKSVANFKIREGMNMRDSIALTLLTMDYEKDDYNTPRIAGAIDLSGNGYIGIVTDSGIEVKKVNPNEAYYVSTYEHNSPRSVDYPASNAKEATEYIFGEGVFSEFTHPVTSCAAFAKDKWDIEFKNP